MFVQSTLLMLALKKVFQNATLILIFFWLSSSCSDVCWLNGDVLTVNSDRSEVCWVNGEWLDVYWLNSAWLDFLLTMFVQFTFCQWLYWYGGCLKIPSVCDELSSRVIDTVSVNCASWISYVVWICAWLFPFSENLFRGAFLSGVCICATD
jgi:hypothetical protein